MSRAGEVTGLRPIGAWLLAGSAVWWVASAVAKEEFFLGDSAQEKALAIAQHVDAFRAFHVVAGLGTVLATVGVVVLGRWLRAQRASRLVDIAVASALVGTAAWLVEIGIRMTVGIDRARAVVAGTGSPGDEPSVGNVLMFAIAGLAFVVPMVLAWVLARRRVPGRRSSLAVAVLLTLVTAAAVATYAISLVYQFGTLPMALVLLLARTTPSASVARQLNPPSGAALR
jgi:hypothetical protein